MGKCFFFGCMFFLNSFLLADSDIRSIAYLELPSKAQLVSIETLENFVQSKAEVSEKNSEVDMMCIEILKGYFNQVDLLIEGANKDLLSRYAESLSLFISSSPDAYNTYFDSMFAFCRGLKRINYIPNPPSKLILKKNEILKLCKLLNAKISSDYIDKFYAEINLNKFSRITLGDLSLASPKLLKKYIEHKIMSLDKERRIYHYHEWLPSLAAADVLKIYPILESEEKAIFAEVVFSLCDISSSMLSHFKILAEDISPEKIAFLFNKALEEKNYTKCAIIRDLVPKHIFSSKEDLSKNILPGRYGSDKIFTATIGNTELIFHMDQKKFVQSLNLVNDVNNKTIISLNKTSGLKPKEGYVTAHEKYLNPLGYSNINAPVYYDPYGYEFESRLLAANTENLNQLLEVKPSFTKGRLDLCVNHTGAEWKSINSGMFDKALDKKENIGESWNFSEYTMADWQLSPGVITGLLLHDPKSFDRFILPLFTRDRLSVCFLNKKSELKKMTDDKCLQCIQIGAIDHNSFTTPGSTKGKSINSVFWGSIDSNNVAQLKKKSHNLPVNPSVSSKRGKKYASGVELLKLPFSADIENVELSYVSSQCSVDIYKIQNKPYAKLESKFQALLGSKSRLKKVYRVVKESPGFTPLEKLELPILEKNTILVVNRSKFPKGCLDFPIAESFLNKNLPWIQLFHLPKNSCLKAMGKVFKHLELTPLEEILFRDTLAEVASDDVYKNIEKFEIELDILIFEHD